MSPPRERGKSTGSLASLRQRNRRTVLQAIQTGRATTRMDIARVTGLSRSTVASVVADLLNTSVLVETDTRPLQLDTATFGRPPVGLAMHPATGGVMAIHLRHDGVRVALADLNGTILATEDHDSDVDHEPSDALQYAATTARTLIAGGYIEPERITAVGVAVAAPVLSGSRVLASPSTMHDWSDIDVAQILNKEIGLPIRIGNDANFGALAESRFGAGRCVGDFIYVMLSDGVGAGLVLRRSLYEGATGAAGELGHVTIDADGFICRCGNRGCLETVAGSRALIDALAHSHGPQTTLDDVLALVRCGDAGARRAVTDAGRAVGRALAGIVTMLDPKRIIIGGKVAAAGPPLLDGIRDILEIILPPVTNQAIEIVPAELGDKAEIMGAVAAASEIAVPQLMSNGVH